MCKTNTFQEWCEEILPIVQAAANGEPIQVSSAGHWYDVGPDWGVLIKGRVYRIQPKTIRIGEYDVPEPIREVPGFATRYFECHLTNEHGYIITHWYGSAYDMWRLQAGIIHSTAAAAALHTKAMLSLTKVGA